VIGKNLRVVGSRRATRLLGVLTAVGAGLALAAASPAGAAQLRGVALHPMGIDKSTTTIQTEFGMLQAARADTVRFDIFWSSVEQHKGQYDAPTLSWIDWVMGQAHQHGLKVILDIDSTPCWASSVPATVDPVGCHSGWWYYPVTDYAPTNPQDYANFAAYAATRWGSNLAALELWNEPDYGVSWLSPYPAHDYAALVNATYPTVKAVAPDLPVIMSLGGNSLTFLDKLYSWGVQGNYDGIAVHPYYQPTFSGLKGFRAEQLKYGDHAPLWVTEVGWSSLQYGLQGQAQNITSALNQLAALPYVADVDIYDMHDDGTDPANAEDHFGLVDFNLNPKPAWYAFQSGVQSLAKH